MPVRQVYNGADLPEYGKGDKRRGDRQSRKLFNERWDEIFGKKKRKKKAK
jgi:hypothetical protein